MQQERDVIAPASKPQELFINSEADITIASGSAGSSKSYSILLRFLRYIGCPYSRGVIFRRTSTQLLEQGAEINTIASFLGIANKQIQEAVVSKYKLSERSLKSLEGVDPNLVKIVKRAIEITEQDFIVIEGLRTKEQMMINYGKGRTAAQLAVHGIPASYAKPKEAKVTWLNNPFASNHAKGKAVDIVPNPVDWNSISKFKKINEAMQAAAKELGVKLSYGGDWTKKDYPHWELA